MSKIQQYKDLITGVSKANARNRVQDTKDLLEDSRDWFETAYKSNKKMAKQYADRTAFSSALQQEIADNFNSSKSSLDNARIRVRMFSNDFKRKSADLKKITNATTGARLGTALTGAAALGAGAYGLKKLHDKKKQEKTAFDIVNDSFEKIAKEK